MSGREFSGFDVETLARAVSPPPFDELRSAARSRRHRSVTMVAAALVALVGLAVVPVVAGAGGAERVIPTQPSTAHGDAFTLTGPDSGVDVWRDGCVVRFAYTGDRGRTWSDWDAAVFDGTRCAATSTGTVASRIEVSVLSDRSYLVSDVGVARLSTDYGRTWRDAVSAIVAVPAFPATARPVFCGFGCEPLSEPLAVDPSSGTVYRLTTAPSWRPLFSLYPAADGSIWAAYRMGRASGSTLARSADRGATWTTWEVDDDASVVAVVGLDDREGYVLTEPSGTGGGTRLLRTTDGAKTWTDTGTDLPDEAIWDLTVGSDGSLLAISPGGGAEPDRLARLLVSRDDGRHFTVAREYGPVVGTASVAPGYAWLFGRGAGPMSEPDHLLVTSDATTWTRFTLSP
ncbi:WD40/YVTN/BNR-like repeat-containing protein [Micromonospora sp. NPDC047557]|uniref:WD40/YVTN/BNR-like repeat-containing protein n=1 Tax=Micromonospora sp. NPDC047557 TaxID=3364250 RepID=UPI00370FFCF1